MVTNTPARSRALRYSALTAGVLAAAATASACGGSAGPASPIGSAATKSAPASPVRVPATTTVAPATTASTVAPSNPATSAPVAAVPSSAHGVAAAACPVTLPVRLASTGSARQLITVEAAGYGTTHATLQTWQQSGSCWTAVAGPWTARIGQNGFSDHHVEGDAASPTGIFGIGPVIYGNAPNPGVQETYHQLVCGDWWDSDPTSPDYNTFQHVPCGTTPPFGGGSQALWTEPVQFPSFAVIDYNTAPAIPYNGSAEFLQADTGSATDGCVALPLAQLDQVLRWIDPADSPAIVMGPASEIASF